MNTTTLIARNAARNARVTIVCQRANINAVRKYAQGPSPLDSSSAKSPKSPEAKGVGQPLFIGALLAGGGVVGYYYWTRSTDEQAKDVKRKARELDHAARVQTQAKIEEGRDKYDQAKADGRARVDSAQSSVQSTYNEAANKASSAAAEAQAKLASYKDAAASSLQHSKEATEKTAHDAKAYAEEKTHQAQSSWWSWFGWGKSKVEDTKEKAAAEAAKAARDIKEKAGEAEKGAQKRT